MVFDLYFLTILLWHILRLNTENSTKKDER